ncbi:MAG: hypothetical protein HC880_22355 [Bacteroidia bacterium]|nr:hypothetical protein [Bacteroidia bacterium]
MYILLNPGHIDINQVRMAIDDQGQLANYDNSFSVLSGFSLEKNLLLSEAGLLLGQPDGPVSDALRNETGLRNRDFTVKNPLKQIYKPGESFLQTISVFEDIPDNSEQIGLEVTQKTYAWNESDLTRVIIVEYQIKNLLQKKPG